MPTITPEESKLVGFDDELIDSYPSSDQIREADRLQLIRWYRFLVEPRTATELSLQRLIIELLEMTCPPVGKREPPKTTPHIEDAD